MKKRLKNKLRAKRGMTLTEVLVAVLILSLVTVGVAAGVSSSVKVYRKSVQFSESRTLCATLSQAVMDELRYATDIGSQSTNPTFTNQSGESVAIAAVEGQLKVGNRALVSTGAYNKMTAAVEYTYASGIFEVELTIKDNGGNTIHSTTFSVSTFN